MKTHHWLWIIGGVVAAYIVYKEFLSTGSLSSLVSGSASSAGAS